MGNVVADVIERRAWSTVMMGPKDPITVRVGWACLLFGVQRSSEGCKWRVVVVDETLEVVPNKSKMGSYVSEVV